MTILLEPEIKARLRERAAHEGQALPASGLVKRIARRTEPDTSERHLIEVQGKPVSETVLRERR